MAFRDSPRIRRHVRGDGRESACSITTVDDAGPILYYLNDIFERAGFSALEVAIKDE